MACGISKAEVSYINKKFESTCNPKSGVSMEDTIGAGAIVDNLECENFTDLALISQVAYRSQLWRERIKKHASRNSRKNLV